MINLKRNMILIFTFVTLLFSSSLSQEITQYDIQKNVNYNHNNATLFVDWIMYDFEIEEVNLYFRTGGIKNSLENLKDFYLKVEITNDIRDTTLGEYDGKVVKQFYATIKHEIKEYQEVVLMEVVTKQGTFYSFPSLIKRSNNNNPKSIVFTNMPPEQPLIPKGSTLFHDFDAKTKDGEGEIKYSIISQSGDMYQDVEEFTSIDENTGEFEFLAMYSGRYTFNIQASMELNGAKITATQVLTCIVDTCERSSRVSVLLSDQNGNMLPKEHVFLVTDMKNQNDVQIFKGQTNEKGEVTIPVLMCSYYLVHFSQNGGVEQYYNNAKTPMDAEKIEVNNCNEEVLVEFKIRTNLDSNNQNNILFTKLPKTGRLKVGEEFKTTIKAEVKGNPNAEIVYSIESDTEGMEINPETGEFTWTPMEEGGYYVYFKAHIKGDEFYSTHYLHTFDVSNCVNPSTVVLYVNDTAGNRMNNLNAHVRLFELVDKNGPNEEDIYMRLKTGLQTKLQNGFAHFAADEGEYVLMLEVNNTFYWYENTLELKDAKILEIACGDTMELTMTVDLYKFKKETTTVSGYCLDENGHPIMSKITFEGHSANNGHKTHYVGMANNNNNGYYSVELPKGMNFIAYAMTANSKTPLYFNQTYNYYEAEYIKTDKDKIENVNFVFNKIKDSTDQKQFAKVSGNVVSLYNQLIEGVFVVALNAGDDHKPRHNSGVTYLAEDGSFEFELPVGNYVFLAIPQSNDYIPGFYNENGTSKFTWEDATIVNLSANSAVNFDIILQELEKKPGIARVNGSVKTSSDKSKIDNANIMLLDENKAVEFTITNYNGEFDILDIADGDYTLVVDKVGFEKYEANITLDSENPLNLNIEMQAVAQPSSVENGFDINIAKVYPNPSTNYIELELDSKVNFNQFEIYNLKGELITSGSYNIGMKVDVSKLNSGKYFIKLINNDDVLLAPFNVER